MTEYATQKQSLIIFNMMLHTTEKLIHSEFMIVEGVYKYNMYTENFVYSITIDSRGNQLIAETYSKTTDRTVSDCRNIRSNVTRKLVNRFNEFKTEELGY